MMFSSTSLRSYRPTNIYLPLLGDRRHIYYSSSESILLNLFMSIALDMESSMSELQTPIVMTFVMLDLTQVYGPHARQDWHFSTSCWGILEIS